MPCLFVSLCFFFFQAEDGIRDLTVTGVQTCALPISRPDDSVTTPRRASTSRRRGGAIVSLHRFRSGSKRASASAPCTRKRGRGRRSIGDRKSVVRERV